MWAMVKDLSNLEIADRMISLLEKQVELQEESNELARENNQLLGDVLQSLDTLANRPAVVNMAPGSTHIDTNVDVSTTKNVVKEPTPKPDAEALFKAMFGDAGPDDEAPMPDFSVFWPKKGPAGWVRVSIQHPSGDSLTERVRRGCLCGKPIVLKELNGGTFYTCEAVSLKGSCSYRPAAYFDKNTFLTNLPPEKV
jgi:hypothetical protein